MSLFHFPWRHHSSLYYLLPRPAAGLLQGPLSPLPARVGFLISGPHIFPMVSSLLLMEHILPYFPELINFERQTFWDRLSKSIFILLSHPVGHLYGSSVLDWTSLSLRNLKAMFHCLPAFSIVIWDSPYPNTLYTLLECSLYPSVLKLYVYMPWHVHAI